jgi:hypothetical protein
MGTYVNRTQMLILTVIHPTHHSFTHRIVFVDSRTEYLRVSPKDLYSYSTIMSIEFSKAIR